MFRNFLAFKTKNCKTKSENFLNLSAEHFLFFFFYGSQYLPSSHPNLEILDPPTLSHYLYIWFHTHLCFFDSLTLDYSHRWWKGWKQTLVFTSSVFRKQPLQWPKIPPFLFLRFRVHFYTCMLSLLEKITRFGTSFMCILNLTFKFRYRSFSGQNGLFGPRKGQFYTFDMTEKIAFLDQFFTMD